MDSRLCDCHGEPMYWNRDRRYGGNGFWRCAVRKRERVRARYHERPLEERTRINQEKYERLMEDPQRAFRKRVREIEAYHRKRLADLTEAVTEGGRDDAEVQAQE